jgi:flagellar biosynthesis/type III secretory pathway M-ring protein FliF/YscJ
MFWLKIWAWLKKYWKWLLFPVGIVIGILSVIGRRRSPVVAPEVLEAEKARQEAEEAAQKKLDEADKIRREKVEFIRREHAETLKKLTDDQRSRVEELREDPDELNEFLRGVGEEIRS